MSSLYSIVHMTLLLKAIEVFVLKFQICLTLYFIMMK